MCLIAGLTKVRWYIQEVDVHYGRWSQSFGLGIRMQIGGGLAISVWGNNENIGEQLKS